MSRTPGPARGILRPHAAAVGRFEHQRLAPPVTLAGVVEHFWWVSWDLEGGPPQQREVLPHPSIHWVFEHCSSRINGLERRRFVRELAGCGRVFGVKFRPGGFRPLLGAPVAALTGRSLPASALWGADCAALERAVAAAAGAQEAAALVTPFLAARLAAVPVDPLVERIAQLVYTLQHEHALIRVEQVVAATGIQKRRLQRWFREYVGLSPKWVLQRYRLHEALERLERTQPAPDWAQLALDLGWFDQAHFIRDFRALTGTTPTAYRRRT